MLATKPWQMFSTGQSTDMDQESSWEPGIFLDRMMRFNLMGEFLLNWNSETTGKLSKKHENIGIVHVRIGWDLRLLVKL